jgi:Usher syndrome type-1G protein
LHFFLAANGLNDFADLLVREKIDLDSLILLTEADLKNLGLPLGPRRKLLQAITERKSALEDPGELEDSHL